MSKLTRRRPAKQPQLSAPPPDPPPVPPAPDEELLDDELELLEELEEELLDDELELLEEEELDATSAAINNTRRFDMADALSRKTFAL